MHGSYMVLFNRSEIDGHLLGRLVAATATMSECRAAAGEPASLFPI